MFKFMHFIIYKKVNPALWLRRFFQWDLHIQQNVRSLAFNWPRYIAREPILCIAWSPATAKPN